jgi:hypothetical protein
MISAELRLFRPQLRFGRGDARRIDGEDFEAPRSPIAHDRENQVSNQDDEHQSKQQISDYEGEGRAKIGNTSR